jgi:exopolyphosphatase/pppGpp-phosphohydrolase
VQILDNHFETCCGSFFKEVYQPILVGTAGMFETLATEIQPLILLKGPEELNLTSVKMCLKSWLSSTNLSRETKTEIIQVRRKTLHLGAALLLWILKKAAVEKIIATPNSLAEGKALEYFEKLGLDKR